MGPDGYGTIVVTREGWARVNGDKSKVEVDGRWERVKDGRGEDDWTMLGALARARARAERDGEVEGPRNNTTWRSRERGEAIEKEAGRA